MHGLADCDWIDLVCSTEMGQAGKGAHYKFMIVQPNGKWMQEISDLIEQVASASCVSKQVGYSTRCCSRTTNDIVT